MQRHIPLLIKNTSFQSEKLWYEEKIDPWNQAINKNKHTPSENMETTDKTNEEVFAFPFSNRFDIAKVKASLSEGVETEEVNNVCKFLSICHELYLSVNSEVERLCRSFDLNATDVLDYSFACFNRNFINLSKRMLHSVQQTQMFEKEKVNFIKIQNQDGSEAGAKFAVEIGVDVLNEFIHFISSDKISPASDAARIKAGDTLENFEKFNAIFLCLNTLINVRENAYDVFAFEQGKITFRNGDSEVKVESFFERINQLKTANDIRTSNHIQEYTLPLLLTGKKLNTIKGIVSNGLNEMTLLLKVDQINAAEVLKHQIAAGVYFQHIVKAEMSYFGKITFDDLFFILSLIITTFELLVESYGTKLKDIFLNEVPVRIRITEIRSCLQECSGFPEELIDQVLNSLTFGVHSFSFWKAPFYKVGDYYYVHLLTLTSPNLTLFGDTWSRLQFSLPELERKLKTNIESDLKKNGTSKFKMRVLDGTRLLSDGTRFANNVIIELSGTIILIEVKCYPFSINPNEYAETMNLLAIGVEELKTKEGELKIALSKKGKGNLNVVKLVVTNYTNLSGLIVDGVPHLDLILLKNYLSAGALKRGTVRLVKGQMVQTEAGSIKYYSNETEFNNNLDGFCLRPAPIYEILQRFTVKEIQITPAFMSPRFFVNITEHITEEQLIANKIDQVGKLLSYEYFSNPKKVNESTINDTINYTLSDIFHRIAYLKSEVQINRVEIYRKISKVNLHGFFHLSQFMLQGINGLLNRPNVKRKGGFKSVKYGQEEIEGLVGKFLKTHSGPIRLSLVTAKNGTFKKNEIIKLVSFARNTLYLLSPRNMFSDIDGFFVPLTILRAFRKDYDLVEEFYACCGNIVEAYNNLHHYQPARDFCEEVLACSVQDKKTLYGWNILFKCYTQQKNLFEASISGCLTLAVCDTSHSVKYQHKIDVLHNCLKFFRDFRYEEFARAIYNILKTSNLEAYDKQKIALSYFNMYLISPREFTADRVNEAILFFENNRKSIIAFEDYGVVPWLTLFYNFDKLRKVNPSSQIPDVSGLISSLEHELDATTVNNLKDKVLGNTERSKDLYISALSKIYQTRSSADFIYETRNLSILTNSLLEYSIELSDIHGLFLAGLTLNDQSFSFNEVFINPGTLKPGHTYLDEKLERRLREYDKYIVENLQLRRGQLAVWFFNHDEKVYYISVSSEKEVRLVECLKWSIQKMSEWVSELSKFYFNSQKETYYDFAAQEKEYEKVLGELEFTLVEAPVFSELLLASSVDLSSIPHNLIRINGDFVGKTVPVCNVVSFERYIEKSKEIILDSKFSMSYWIPIEDQDPTINWGFSKLQEILDGENAIPNISRYPGKRICTDLNVFMAHGVLDTNGFKAVYSDEEGFQAISFPYHVFGEGKIAVLFICNSASMSEGLFSNNINSFACGLLKSDYEAVVAPFWKFDVTIAPLWLKAFLQYFHEGKSVCEAVFMANSRVAGYDEESGLLFYAPAGSLAMHLYGNPNIYVRS